jgi:RNA polymerase sigma-70 factor, ECF subfamily
MTVLELPPRPSVVPRQSLASDNKAICDEDFLVAKAKSGHSEAFGELYKRHQSRTYRAALRILRNQQDAEDAVQRAFQRALLNLQRFREDSTFATWLTRIVINEALMLLRQRRSREPFKDNRSVEEQRDGAVVVVDKRPTPEELLCENERHTALLKAIGRLRENLRVVVLHRELKGLTSAETAEILGLTVGAVKARAFHAKRFLRKCLERKFQNGDLAPKSRKPFKGL